jgi:predicted dehydrogenase
MTIHDFDMARFLLGEEPVSVSATAAVLVDKSVGDALRQRIHTSADEVVFPESLETEQGAKLPDRKAIRFPGVRAYLNDTLKDTRRRYQKRFLEL